MDSIFGQQGSRSPSQGHHDLSPFSTTENHLDLPPRCHRYPSPRHAVQMPSVARPDVHSSSAREGAVDHVLVHQPRALPKGSVDISRWLRRGIRGKPKGQLWWDRGRTAESGVVDQQLRHSEGGLRAKGWRGKGKLTKMRAAQLSRWVSSDGRMEYHAILVWISSAGEPSGGYGCWWVGAVSVLWRGATGRLGPPLLTAPFSRLLHFLSHLKRFWFSVGKWNAENQIALAQLGFYD